MPTQQKENLPEVGDLVQMRKAYIHRTYTGSGPSTLGIVVSHRHAYGGAPLVDVYWFGIKKMYIEYLLTLEVVVRCKKEVKGKEKRG